MIYLAMKLVVQKFSGITRSQLIKLSTVLTVLILVAVLINCSLIFTTQSKVPRIVDIPLDADVYQISELLWKNKVISNKQYFVVLTRVLGLDNKLRAGRYSFLPYTPVPKVLDTLTHGGKGTKVVTISAGLSAEQIARVLERKLNINGARFLKLVHDEQFCKKLGIQANSLEGYLFPGSYNFWSQIDEHIIIEMMVRKFNQIFDDELKHRTQSLGFTQHQIITLASIIEKEALIDSERPIISAVFHNRLRRNYPLESCASVEYAIGTHKSRLKYSDLRIDSPYNTYRYVGLPPGPICNPGVASIKAALYPAKVSYFFFVAKGDDTHIFSYTPEQHLTAIKRIHNPTDLPVNLSSKNDSL